MTRTRMPTVVSVVAVLVAALVAWAPPAGAAPGELDPTFGSGGKVTTDFEGGSERAHDVVLQPDGKLVAAGFSGAGTGRDFALARYHPDGSLDEGFGNGGRVTTDFFEGDDEINDVLIQPDGRVVAAGVASSTDGQEFALARYNPDGSLDETFDTDGKVTTIFPGGIAAAEAVVFQDDGKLVAAGNASSDFALARYEEDGSLDGSFGSGGTVTTDFNGGIDGARGLVLQPDGKLVAAGQARVGNSYAFALVRYEPDGSVDTGFGSAGKVTTDFGGNGGWAHELVLQPDGKLVAAGHAGTSTQADFALARYEPDGSLDTGFGSGGTVTTDVAEDVDEALGLVLQPDGKLVAAGYGWTGSDDDFVLARYNADGSEDDTFGTGGMATTDFAGNSMDAANALVLQPDGKLVAAGYAFGGNDFALARYLGDGAPVPDQADLALRKRDSADPVRSGNQFRYLLALYNRGPHTATDVVVTDKLPPEVRFVSVQANKGACSESGGTVTCNVGPLAPQEEARFSIVVTAEAVGTATNTAEATAAEEDTDPTNNTATEETQITGAATATLTVEVTGRGRVFSSQGIRCPDDCTETYPAGTTVRLNARPGSGWSFAGWGGDCAGTDTCTVVMSEDRHVTATFTET